MICSIRGTHGSGKSTVVKTILDRYNATPIEMNDKGHPIGYSFEVPWLSKPVYIIGSYKTACGGCDGIQPYALIWPRVEAFAKLGHVLFEGALVSSSYGNIGRASEVYGDDMVFAFLDTPVKTCLERIGRRRMLKGKLEPVDPHNTTKKHENVARSIGVIRKLGRRVVIIDHRKAVAQILGLLRNAEAIQPEAHLEK